MNLNVLMMISAAPAAGQGIKKFFENAQTVLADWGGAGLMALGIIMMIVAAVKVGKALMGNSQQQTPWMQMAMLFIFGGALMVGGFELLRSFSDMANESINELAGNAALFSSLRW